MKIDSKRKFQRVPANMSIEMNVERYLEDRATPERLRKGSDFHILERVQRLCGPLLALHRAGDI